MILHSITYSTNASLGLICIRHINIKAETIHLGSGDPAGNNTVKNPSFVMELTVPWGRRERIYKMNKQSHDGWCQILSREIKHHLGSQSAKRVKQGRREWDLMERPLVDEGAY